MKLWVGTYVLGLHVPLEKVRKNEESYGKYKIVLTPYYFHVKTRTESALIRRAANVGVS